MTINTPGIPKNAEIRSIYSHGRSLNKRITDAFTPNLVQIPSFYFPHSGFTGSLWITMQPMQLKNINSGGRGGNFVLGDKGPIYKFLAPHDGVNETHNHEWSETQTMYSRLLGLLTKIETGWNQIFTGADQASKSILNTIKKLENGQNIGIAHEAKSAALRATNQAIPRRRVDAPLSYSNSPRRVFLFNFPLLSEGIKTDLVSIVKDMERYAAPTQENEETIVFPWVWSLQTDPPGILDVDLAACTSIQTTWQNPYIGGVPQRCDLTIGFTDISPLFAETIRLGSIVQTTTELDKQDHTQEIREKGTLAGQISGMQREIQDRISKARNQAGF